MSLIGTDTRISDRPHAITLTNPGTTGVPDGDGGYVIDPVPLNPPIVYGKIQAATTADLEQLASGTVLAQAELLITIPFHPQISTLTRCSWRDLAGRQHTAAVTGAVDPDHRCRELVLGVVEVVE